MSSSTATAPVIAKHSCAVGTEMSPHAPALAVVPSTIKSKIKNAIVYFNNNNNINSSSSATSQGDEETPTIKQQQDDSDTNLQKLLQKPEAKELLKSEFHYGTTTMLHFACGHKDVSHEAVRQLLKLYLQLDMCPAILSKTNTEGETPIRRAVSSTDQELIKILVAFFHNQEECDKVLAMRTGFGFAVTDVCKSSLVKEILQKPKCWEECVKWYREVYAEDPYNNNNQKSKKNSRNNFVSFSS